LALRRRQLRSALGPAFARQSRDLTAQGRTKDDHVPDPADAGPGRVVVVIPAHEEGDLVGEALESIAAQTRQPDEVIVVADRCTDQTRAVALAHGAEVRTTVGNDDKKAGALNQVLASLLPRLSDNDAVLIMDADSSLSPEFVADATRALRSPEGDGALVGAVGGIFLGYPVTGFLGRLQDNEYVRYARDIARRKGRADVLTGTASLFSVRALRFVEIARVTGALPPSSGVYDVKALTEDNELTLALKHLGFRCVSPKACTVGTELMPTTSRLFHQRLRWQRGALQNLLVYGVTRHTGPYLARQAMTYAAVGFMPFFLTTMAYSWLASGRLPWSWFWVVVTGFVLFERVWSVKRGGWRAISLAVTVVPEALYDLVLHAVYTRSLTDVATRATATWDRATAAEAAASRGRRPAWHAVAGGVYTAGLLAFAIGAAVVLDRIGAAWPLIAAFVLTGAATAALRLLAVDPLGLLLGTGELQPSDYARRARPQGFGGAAVPPERMRHEMEGRG
jgi:poly-beta-1,6-N-acetyl-D-glucosamine synthase